MTRILLWLALLIAVPGWAKPPRLTLFIVVDALGSDVLLRNRASLNGGLGQAISRGAYYPTMRFEFSELVTAAGHATLSTGANPWRHGAVGNRALNRQTGQIEPIFADPHHPVLEAPATNDDASPARLLAETLADRLRFSTGMRGKVVAISGKARASIPMAGRLGQAWWFHEDLGRFVTGTWYAKALPSWVRSFNERKPADAWFGKAWRLALPETSYLGEDDRPWESDRNGLGRTFPHPLGAGLSAPGPGYYAALANSPMAGDLIVQLAKAALEGEQLGRDEQPDLLFVGFSALDRIYHHYGPNSWEMQDALVRLDRQLADLIGAAERAAGGAQNLFGVITADHGGAAIPEEWAAAGLPAARVNPAELQDALAQELRRKFNADLVLGMEEEDVYLNARAIAERGLDAATVRRSAAQWLRSRPEIAVAVARDDLFTSGDVAGFSQVLRQGYFPERSGDVLLIPREYHVLLGDPHGTTHATPYAYDALVPLVLFGRDVRPGVYRRTISAVDVAPTIASVLEMAPPAMCEGTARDEALDFRGRPIRSGR